MTDKCKTTNRKVDPIDIFGFIFFGVGFLLPLVIVTIGMVIDNIFCIGSGGVMK